MNDKFKVCHGLTTKILAIIIGVVNIGTPICLIIRTIVIWEGVGKLVGMCFVALLVMLMFSLPAVLLNIMAWDYVKIEGRYQFQWKASAVHNTWFRWTEGN